MINRLNRRSMMVRGGQSLGVLLASDRRLQAATPIAKIHDLKVISQTPQHYCGWPTLTRRASGELVLVYSGGRDAHVCPLGRVEMMRSQDDGQTWTWPRVLHDGPLDDRDAGVLETRQGTLLVTTFNSVAYDVGAFSRAVRGDKQAIDSIPQERFERWQAVHRRVTEAQRQGLLGQWMLRSIDGGFTWSTRYSSIVNSPHGPIELSDGRLLYAGKELWTGQRRVGVCESADDGVTWDWLSDIPIRDGDDAAKYHELHAVEAVDGRIIVHIRNHNQTNAGEVLQCESIDGGRSWSQPVPIGVWGLPSFLLRLRDGRLLMSYGYRRRPFGVQARVSTDKGRSWNEPVRISEDGTSGDLGYPSTVELSGGDLLTIWYERQSGSEKAVLRQARWSLP